MALIRFLLNSLDQEEKREEGINGNYRCVNPRCITSIEQELDHRVKCVDPEDEIYRCIYCEKKAIKEEK